ncbi:MAG: hypothetical protein GX417_07785 [Clostridiales bacterium]|nr:hypothetical protein [Clostridiales bacterium]
MEKPVLVKCHLCGATAQSAFAYALFSEREKYLGVIYRGVCKECLDQYIDRIKTARRGRAEGLIWLAMFLPAGVLLALLAQQAAFRASGYALVALAFLLLTGSRLQQLGEAKRARRAGDAENEAKYGEQICREDARHTSRRAKLIPLRPEYAEEGFSASRIGEENGISSAAAETVKTAASQVLANLPGGTAALP